MVFKHPFFKAGFRPFFFVAMIAGVVLPWLWLKVLFGEVSISRLNMSSLSWHVHEMYFGFGMAVLGGFLLTASKNWVKIRGIHGMALGGLWVTWLIERVVMWNLWSVENPIVLFLLQNIFLFILIPYLLFTLIKYRGQDTFKDNFYFLLILPMLLVAKIMLLRHGDYKAISELLIGIFRVAFAVMFERTITQFMKNSQGVVLLRHALLDHSIKAILLILIFLPILPQNIGSVLALLAGVLFLLRGVLWRPLIAFRSFGIAVMYVGYFSLGVHLVLTAGERFSWWATTGTMAQHWFSFFVMGVIIPAMFIRIIQGHTGRKIIFTFTDKLALGSMILAGVVRTILPQYFSEHYQLLLNVSAVLWSFCFLLILLRLSPFLFVDRIDGKEH
ncbi:MAG: NnrS family protein [Bdellovibrionia bacterium]